jgi:predicted RNA-binding Zn ribbon-like protein
VKLVTEPAHPIPDWLEPVLAFVNTIDVEEGTDELAAGPAALSAWLAARGLLLLPERSAAAPTTASTTAAAVTSATTEATTTAAAPSAAAPAPTATAPASAPTATAPASAPTATAPAAATAAEYRLALDLRAGLRSLALANNGVPVAELDLAAIRRVLAKLPLVIDPAADGSILSPYRDAPVTAALSRLAAGYAAARAAGLWHRLRRCPADDCAWAFWDSSAKGTRRWCTMRVCGNRAKARTFARRRGDRISER